VHNGLLLAAHFDALFDRGLISFADDGSLLLSDAARTHRHS
jgi:putative restriction endonuclease